MSEGKAGNRVAREFPGLLRDLTQKVLGPNGEEWLDPLKLLLHKKNAFPEKPAAKAKNPTSGLFEIVKKVKLTELGEFRPTDKFVAMPDEKERAKALVSVGYVDSDFQALMSKIGVESARGPQILTIRRTRKVATFGQMLPELPKRAKKVSMGQVWQMIEKQGQGQEGDLLVNGWANFFLIEGTDVVLYCYWHPDYRYWYFLLYSTSFSSRWDGGHQFVS